jgi:hypothetical protein
LKGRGIVVRGIHLDDGHAVLRPLTFARAGVEEGGRVGNFFAIRRIVGIMGKKEKSQ